MKFLRLVSKFENYKAGNRQVMVDDYAMHFLYFLISDIIFMDVH